jgi:hypothetical protein
MRQHVNEGPSAVQRHAIGLMVALSLVLVAFEWRGAPRVVKHPLDPLGPEECGVLVAEVPRGHVPTGPKERRPERRIPDAAEPDPAPDGAGDTEATDGSTMEGGDAATGLEASEGTIGDATGAAPPPWTPSASLPYLLDCAGLESEARDRCTEQGIRRVFERELRIPGSFRGRVVTTLHFEVDTLGRATRWRCVPRVDMALEREVERVLRALPPFMPALQNGHKVSVPYRLPLGFAR